MAIAVNKKARFDFFIEDEFQAGLALEGWEAKQIIKKNVRIEGAYVKVINGEAYLVGCHIARPVTASTHIVADESRFKKLLLKKSELNKIIGKSEIKGYSIVALDLHFSNGKIKCQIGLGQGKKNHDKRDVVKTRDIEQDQRRALMNKI